MFIRPFRYERAEGIGHACELLRQHGEGAKVIAGGQSLFPMINAGLVAPEVVVDVSRVPEHRGVVQGDEGYLVIGALTTHAELQRDQRVGRDQPLLAAAVQHVGNVRVRNRGTLGGSLAHADPSAELPLVMTALGASCEVTDGSGTRSVPAGELPVTFFTTQLAPDELIASVRVPTLGPGWGWSFLEYSRRAGDFAVAAVAALVRVGAGAIVEARLAVGGVGDRPIRLGAVEAALAGAAPAEIEERVGALDGLEPLSDTSASADHRRLLARVLSIRALTEACRRSEEAA